MKRIYDWDAKFSFRNHTVADLLACKGNRLLTQTTANSSEEAAAARDAGIDLIMGMPRTPRLFVRARPTCSSPLRLAFPIFPSRLIFFVPHSRP